MSECPLCGYQSATGFLGACPRCLGGIRVEVAELRELYGTLAALLVPGSAPVGERVGGTPSPRIPARLDVLSARGPVAMTTTRRDQVGPLSIPTVLAAVRQVIRHWVDLPMDAMRAERWSTDRQVTEDASFIFRWLDRFAERCPADTLVSVARSIHESREDAWTLAGYRAHRILLGPCPRETAPGQTCGQPLWIDPALDREARCRLCGYAWSRRWWLWIQELATTPDPGNDDEPATPAEG